MNIPKNSPFKEMFDEAIHIIGTNPEAGAGMRAEGSVTYGWFLLVWGEDLTLSGELPDNAIPPLICFMLNGKSELEPREWRNSLDFESLSFLDWVAYHAGETESWKTAVAIATKYLNGLSADWPVCNKRSLRTMEDWLMSALGEIPQEFKTIFAHPKFESVRKSDAATELPSIRLH